MIKIKFLKIHKTDNVVGNLKDNSKTLKVMTRNYKKMSQATMVMMTGNQRELPSQRILVMISMSVVNMTKFLVVISCLF